MQHTEDIGYGVVPIYERAGEQEFLLIRHVHGGHWGFPKGHADPSEEPQDAAQRELREETGIAEVKLRNVPPVVRSYELDGWAGDRIHKTVYFYVGSVSSKLVTIDPREVSEYVWTTYDELGRYLTSPHEQFIRDLGERLGI